MLHLMLLGLGVQGIVMTAIGLGALIFFHELGHFIACRLTGTRVEAFSIGFGPELFGWTRGNTRYRFALIPLGGYVKMAAENPGDAKSDAPDEFPNKSFSARLFIMANGVIFNVILAFVLFVGAFGAGVSFGSPEIGQTTPGGAGWEAGLREGDVVKQINGANLLSFRDIATEVAFSGADETLTFTIQRGDETLDLAVTPRYSTEMGMPTIGVMPGAEPGLHVEDKGAYARAGGRSGDVPIAVGGNRLHSPRDLFEALTHEAGLASPGAKSVPVRLRVRRADGTQADLSMDLPLEDRRQLGVRPYSGTRVDSVSHELKGLIRVGDVVTSIENVAVTDLSILDRMKDRRVTQLTVARDNKPVVVTLKQPMTLHGLSRLVRARRDAKGARVTPVPGLAAARAGVRVGDRIKAIGSKKVSSWSDLQGAVAASKGDQIAVTLQRGDEIVEVKVAPGGFADPSELGFAHRPKMTLHKETGLGAVMKLGWQRTVVFMKQVTLTIRGLVTRRVSAKHIGGPIALAQVTYQMFDHGWGKYLYILAIISINLAVLNMLPIPVLDGGQIVLLCAEKIRGKPLPDRVIGYLQLVGMVLILGLIVLAFWNDIGRLIGES